MTTFVTAAFALLDTDGSGARRMLTVRKQGASRFQLPGGKLEEGETPIIAARRETLEEVGVAIDVAGLLGEFRDVAANEPDSWVEATVFVAFLPEGAEPGPRAEIAETRWLLLDEDLPDDLAPLLANHVVPALRARQQG